MSKKLQLTNYLLIESREEILRVTSEKSSSRAYLYIAHCLKTNFHSLQLVFIDRESLINTFSHHVFNWNESKNIQYIILVKSS